MSTLSKDPHRVLTISIPESVMRSLELKQREIEKEIGMVIPMSRLVANCVRQHLEK